MAPIHESSLRGGGGAGQRLKAQKNSTSRLISKRNGGFIASKYKTKGGKMIENNLRSEQIQPGALLVTGNSLLKVEDRTRRSVVVRELAPPTGRVFAVKMRALGESVEVVPAPSRIAMVEIFTDAMSNR